MSIIHEALKKVQLSLQKPAEDPVEQLPSNPYTAAPIVQPPQEKAVEEKESKSVPHSGLLAGLLAVMAILIVVVCLVYQPQQYAPQIAHWVSKQTYRLQSLSPFHKDGPQPIAMITPATAKAHGKLQSAITSSAALNVEGIMANNGSAVALINGKIYEAGDEIGGTQLVSIDENSITILKDGKTETIQLRR